MGTDISKVESWWEEETKNASALLEPESPRKSYSNRLVAWVDILGMRNLIKSDLKDAEDVFGVMEKLRNFVQIPCTNLAKEA